MGRYFITIKEQIEVSPTRTLKNLTHFTIFFMEDKKLFGNRPPKVPTEIVSMYLFLKMLLESGRQYYNVM